MYIWKEKLGEEGAGGWGGEEKRRGKRAGGEGAGEGERERGGGGRGGTVWSLDEWLTLCYMHVHFSNGSTCTSSSR